MSFRNIFITIFIGFLPLIVRSQSLIEKRSIDSVGLEEKIHLVLKEMELKNAEMQTFREIYKTYLENQKRSFRCSFLTLGNLAKAAAGTNSAEVFACLETQLVMQNKQNRVKNAFFEQIGKEVNKYAAMHFLQMEGFSGISAGPDHIVLNLTEKSLGKKIMTYIPNPTQSGDPFINKTAAIGLVPALGPAAGRKEKFLPRINKRAGSRVSARFLV